MKNELAEELMSKKNCRVLCQWQQTHQRPPQSQLGQICGFLRNWKFTELPCYDKPESLEILIEHDRGEHHTHPNPLSGGGSPAGASVRGSRKRPPYSLGKSTVP